MGERVVGVDEAGKGPVLGSMFAAAVVADPETLPDDVDDSKRLAPTRREEIADRLRSDSGVDVGVVEVGVAEIDDPETDMNTLTVAAHSRALDVVAIDGLRGFVDAGDVDEGRFGRRVTDRTEADLTLNAEHGADAAHAVVAAASVVAKVARDDHVEALADEHGDVGSGYPSDPATRSFLRTHVAEHGALPKFARASWNTCDDVLAAAEQAALDEF